ncbi:hypothetical protein [Neokomagataea thailandica]|uniref:hypothetical protein n=1 Tax=Neokomagataea TaxID=1223423 RepID=UPI000835BAA0|nr:MULTISPECIES: hypothetical protein [Neokomagataea]
MPQADRRDDPTLARDQGFMRATSRGYRAGFHLSWAHAVTAQQIRYVHPVLSGRLRKRPWRPDPQAYRPLLLGSGSFLASAGGYLSYDQVRDAHMTTMGAEAHFHGGILWWGVVFLCLTLLSEGIRFALRSGQTPPRLMTMSACFNAMCFMMGCALHIVL